jgi:hypothetical protein
MDAGGRTRAEKRSSCLSSVLSVDCIRFVRNRQKKAVDLTFGLDQRGRLTTTSKNRPRKDCAGLVSHAAHREAGRRGTSVPIQIAVRCIIGVLVAPVVIAATEPEASAAMKVIAAEVAAHLGMLTRKAATESRATTGEIASAKAAAHASAAAEPAAHVAATEPAAMSTPTTVSTPASPAARERVSGQSPGESGGRRQNDHGLA